MTYATKQGMIDRYGETDLIELTDRTEPYTGAIVDSRLDRAMADADQEVDSYLRTRYELPLASVPDIVTRLASDIAFYLLHHGRATEEVEKRYQNAVKVLRSISKREMDIGIAEDDVPSNDMPIRVDSPGRVFTDETLEDY